MIALAFLGHGPLPAIPPLFHKMNYLNFGAWALSGRHFTAELRRWVQFLTLRHLIAVQISGFA